VWDKDLVGKDELVASLSLDWRLLKQFPFKARWHPLYGAPAHVGSSKQRTRMNAFAALGHSLLCHVM